MEWHVKLNGQEEGPLSEEQFQQYVREGKITDETPVWKHGMEVWVNHGSLDKLVPPPLPPSAGASVADRVVAMGLDVFVAYIIAKSVMWMKDAQYPGPNSFQISILMSLVLTVVPWVLFMAACVEFFGGTPGKLALRLRVIGPSGGQTPFAQTVVREVIRLYAPVKIVSLFFVVADAAVSNGIFRAIFGLLYPSNLLVMFVVFAPALVLLMAHTVIFGRYQIGLHDMVLGTRTVRS